MMQKKRPILKPGDVCRIARKKRRYYKAKASMVVVKILRGDGSEGDSEIQCSVSIPSRWGIGGFKRPYKHKFRRDHLWFTGYNINDGQRNKSRVEEPKRGEEKCRNRTCNKTKDIGRPCWWCGTV